MAGRLQGDQRALLQLLYERGQGYEDISGLLGVPADEVRERARAALETIGGADPDAEVPLTDYLLGKADPIARADAIRYLQADPEALALAERIQSALTLLAPKAKPVKLPEPRGRTRKAAIPALGGDSPQSAEQPTTPSLAATGGPLGEPGSTSRRSRLIALLATAGVLAIVAILAVAGVFAGDEGGEQGAATGTEQSGETGQREITSVDLRPVGGSGVAGEAVFRLIDEQQLVVDLDVQGLDPSPPQGSAYLLWLAIGSQAGYPVSTPLQPDANGSFQNRIAIPTEIAVTFGSAASAVRISQTELSELRKEVRAAGEKEMPILSFVGTELAAGDIPLVREGRGGGGGGQRGSGRRRNNDNG